MQRKETSLTIQWAKAAAIDGGIFGMWSAFFLGTFVNATNNPLSQFLKKCNWGVIHQSSTRTRSALGAARVGLLYGSASAALFGGCAGYLASEYHVTTQPPPIKKD